MARQFQYHDPTCECSECNVPVVSAGHFAIAASHTHAILCVARCADRAYLAHELTPEEARDVADRLYLLAGEIEKRTRA